MLLDGFPHPIGVLIEGGLIQRLPAVQVGNLFNKVERVEQLDPVALVGLATALDVELLDLVRLAAEQPASDI